MARRAIRVVSILAALVATGGLGCSHEATPVVQPDEHPPLPPASGTPIGYLVEGADQLAATSDQRAQLEDIDRDLAAHLAGRDHELRTADPVQAEASQPPPTSQGTLIGGSRTGTNGTGMGIGTQSAGVPDTSGANRSRFPRNSSSGPTQPTVTREIIAGPDAIEAVKRERASDTRVAIRRAFQILSADQQAIARRILVDHGVDPDTGMTGADPAPPKPADH